MAGVLHGNPGWSPSGAEIAIEADWGDYPALEGIWIISSSDPDGVTESEAQRVTDTPAKMDRLRARKGRPDARCSSVAGTCIQLATRLDDAISGASPEQSPPLSQGCVPHVCLVREDAWTAIRHGSHFH